MQATLRTGIFEDTHGNAPRPSWGKGELCPYKHTDGTTSHEQVPKRVKNAREILNAATRNVPIIYLRILGEVAAILEANLVSCIGNTNISFSFA